MKVVFKKLEVNNFRQIADRSFDFSDGLNMIVGQNGSGKSNTLDAITWCLFGKDMDDRTKFEVVPLNTDNTRTEFEPDVSLTLSINGETHVLRRVLKDGKVTVAYIDGAPCKTLREFDSFVADIFETPERFKMYSNPLFFPESHWKEQRETFMQFFPTPEASAVLTKMKDADAGVVAAIQATPPERLQAQVQQEQKDLDVERTKIRNQIELLDEQLEGNQQLDEEKLTEERDQIRAHVSAIRDEIQKAANHNSVVQLRKVEIEGNIKRLKGELDSLQRNAEIAQRDAIARLEYDLISLTDKHKRLTVQYNELRSVDEICPTCGQNLPADVICERNAENNAKRMDIAAEGTTLAESIKKLQMSIELKKKETVTSSKADHKALSDQISDWQKELDSLDRPKAVPTLDEATLTRLDELEKALARADVHRENVARREKLMEREREINVNFERSEVILTTLADFFFRRGEMIVKAVNKQFKNISVKVLELQKNGAAKETFEILKDGVPYSDLNTAGQLEAGLELTGFLKRQLGVECPTLLDNGERYTDVDLTQIDGQLICAVAVKGEKLQVIKE